MPEVAARVQPAQTGPDGGQQDGAIHGAFPLPAATATASDLLVVTQQFPVPGATWVQSRVPKAKLSLPRSISVRKPCVHTNYWDLCLLYLQVCAQ